MRVILLLPAVKLIGREARKANGETCYTVKDEVRVGDQKIRAGADVLFLVGASGQNYPIRSDQVLAIDFDRVEEAIDFLQEFLSGDRA